MVEYRHHGALVARPVAECTAAEVAAALTRCFEGYLTGPVVMDARAYENRFRAENLDPFASRVYLEGDSPAAVLLVARRGWTSRVAAMAVAPGWRGRGLGWRVMEEETRNAAARNDRAVVLEVFEQNAPALHLYEKLGFRATRRLFGYRRKPDERSVKTPDKLSETDPLEVARVVAREGGPDLPWMLCAETLAGITPPARAYHLQGRAYALVADTEAETLMPRALIVPRAYRHQGWGTRLLQALYAQFPDRAWIIPEVIPEDMGGAFLLKLGWERQPLNQLEMRLEPPLESREPGDPSEGP